MPKKTYTSLPSRYTVYEHSDCQMAATCLHQLAYTEHRGHRPSVICQVWLVGRRDSLHRENDQADGVSALNTDSSDSTDEES